MPCWAFLSRETWLLIGEVPQQFSLLEQLSLVHSLELELRASTRPCGAAPCPLVPRDPSPHSASSTVTERGRFGATLLALGQCTAWIRLGMLNQAGSLQPELEQHEAALNYTTCQWPKGAMTATRNCTGKPQSCPFLLMPPMTTTERDGVGTAVPILHCPLC